MKVSEVGFVYSEHYRRDNVGREAAIKSIGGDGDNIVAKFFLERNHICGPEWHWLTDNGIIIVTNVKKNDGKLVCTKLIARPAQLTRYRAMGLKNELDEKTKRMKNWLMPQWLIAKASAHKKAGLNYT